MNYGKIKRLGKGASVLEESQHFTHALASKRMILDLKGELQDKLRKERHSEASNLRHVQDILRRGSDNFSPWPRIK